jgi:hypothetical protein
MPASTPEEHKAIDELWERMGRPCAGCALEWNDWIEAREKLLAEVRANSANIPDEPRGSNQSNT